MSEPRFHSYISLVLFLAVMIALGVWVSCGGNSVPSSSNTGTVTGTVTTTINDPPTCTPPAGPYIDVNVTVTKVTANISSSAGASDSGWQTLVDLTNNPKQIGLLSLASTACTLTTLGSTNGLPPGNYQQIRLYLLANSPASGTAVPSTNTCGGASGPFNCVIVGIPGTALSQAVELQLSSEAQTGIKIPSGQIAGGGITLTQGQSADISIDFNACFSIVHEGNGKYRLKPVLTAGVVALNQNSISGKVVDSVTSNPIAGALVLLEQPEPGNTSVDGVVASGVTASDGTFFFCPLPAGNHDVVVAATVTSSLGVPTAYNPTVTLNVPLGSALDTSTTTITLVPEPTVVGGTTVTSSPGTISGLITTATTSATTGTTADISLLALQSASSTLWVTIPVFSGSTASVTTDSPLPASTTATTCGTGAATQGCVSYTLSVPASNPQVGTYSSSGTTYTAPAANPAIYWVNAQAFVPMNATTNPGAADCTTSSLPASFTSSNSVSVNPGGTATQNFSFTGCQ